MREIAGNRPCEGAGLMPPDDDPLWYDRVESDEAPGFAVRALAGAFVAGAFAYRVAGSLSLMLQRGVFLAFRDVKP